MGGVDPLAPRPASKSASATVLLFVSERVKSGAFWPTCGAPLDAGNCLAMMSVIETKKPKITTLRVVKTAPAIFDRVGFERSLANARRNPITRSNAAKANRSKLTQGKSRVKGHCTKTKK